MKKLLYSSLLLLLMMSCVGNGNVDKSDKDSDSVVVPLMEKPMVQIIGTVGESTTMHVLELITAEGTSAEFEYDESYGGVDVGDKVAVFCQGIQVGHVVNVTALSHLWEIDGTDHQQHLELHDDFTATSYGMDRGYTNWTFMVSAGSDNPWIVLSDGSASASYELQLLTPDSLVIGGGDDAIKMIRIN